MSSNFTDAFDAIATAFGTDATGDVKRDGKTILTDALCVGFDTTREQDDYGRQLGIAATIRYKYSDEPYPKVTEGDVLKVTLDSDNQTTTVRVLGKSQSAGIVRLTVQAEYE
jgi:hypothetical protein